MRKLDEHCAIQDLYKGRSGWPKDVWTEENVEKVREILDHSNGRKSISKLSSITGISKTTKRGIMKDNLKMFPYKPTRRLVKKILMCNARSVLRFARLVTMAGEENFELKKIILAMNLTCILPMFPTSRRIEVGWRQDQVLIIKGLCIHKKSRYG